jgi:hypothetical protein
VLGNFKTNLPYNNVLLLIYGLMIKWPMFMNPGMPIIAKQDSYLYKICIESLNIAFNGNKMLFAVLACLLLYIQALLLNEVVNKNKLYPKPNHLTAMCYLLLTSLFSHWYVLSSLMIVSTFLILIIARLCKLQHVQEANKTFYNIGLMLGLSILIYSPTIVFLLLIFFGLSITRAFRIPEWILVILGVFTPIYLLGSAIFLISNNVKLLNPILGFSIPKIYFSIYEWIALAIIFITVFIGFVFIQQNMRKLLVQSRKSWIVFYLFLFFSLLLPFLNIDSELMYYFFSLIPLSVITASAFLFPERRWFPIFSHWSLFILATIMGYYFVIH